MSIFGRLHLDDVISSLPELGPTISDGEYSWITLIGIMIIQMTVPSVLSMYGVVLGNIAFNGNQDFNVLDEKIILTPILLVAFWNLADPWTNKIVKLASSPRLVSLIGIILLTIGLLASGYLASGGVGAYFASLSAGIVMGIGTSLVMAQSENILIDQFRMKIFLVTTLKNVAYTIGFIISPIYTFSLFRQYSLQTTLLMMAFFFVPSMFASLLLKSSTYTKNTPYTLLTSEEEIEMPTKEDSYDASNEDPRNFNLPTRKEMSPAAVKIEPLKENLTFAFDDDDDNDIFIKPVKRTTRVHSWKDEVTLLYHLKFWIGILALIGLKSADLFLWILFPPLAVLRKYPSAPLYNGVILSIMAGTGYLVTIILSHWNSDNIVYHNLMYGCSIFVNGVIFLVFSHQRDFAWMVILALLSGISIGCMTTNQKSALHYMLNSKKVGIRINVIISTTVGVSILFYLLTSNALTCLRIASAVQITGGICYLLSITFTLLKAQKTRHLYFSK